MNGPFFIQNAAADLFGRVGSGVALDNVDMLDVETVATRLDFQHSSLFPLVTASHHPHGVILANVEPLHHRTSGASETIFRNFFSRSSRATGPKTRVPTGSPASLISTAAFVSKRIYVPSLRRCSLCVRTMTAFTTVPFFAVPSGEASFTAAVTTSPRCATCPAPPPSGLIICSLR